MRNRLKVAETDWQNSSCPYTNTYVTFAKDKQESERFWADRKNLGRFQPEPMPSSSMRTLFFLFMRLPVLPTLLMNTTWPRKKHNQRTAIRKICNHIKSSVPSEDAELYVSKLPHAELVCGEAYDSYDSISSDDIRHAKPIISLIENLYLIPSGLF